MKQSIRQYDAPTSSKPLEVGRFLDRLVAMLTLVATIFYLVAPAARYGMMMTFFIPVCVSGFYIGARRSVLTAGICAVAIGYGLLVGALPDSPSEGWTQGLTLALWTVSLGCCSVCVSGMSHVQLTAMVKMHQKHVSETLVDGLTGLRNRLAFDYEFENILNWTNDQGEQPALLMVDVDHFKKFNDRHGHKAGDFVLREVAEMLTELTRDADIVARFGGEEFVILMPNADVDVAKTAGERICSAIEQKRFHFENVTIRLTVSVGIAVRQPDEPGEALIDRADAALYTSKHAGRNCVHYHDGVEFKPCGTTLALYDSASDSNLDAIADDAYLEKVTGLPHRRVFQEELKRRLVEAERYNRKLSLIFVTIDGYQKVIDMGAEAEAAVLPILAEKLRACLRDCDLGSRTGRCEFSALLPDTSLENARVPAERIRGQIASCTNATFRGVSFKLVAAVGVAHVTEGDNAVSIVERAEAAARSQTQKTTS